MLGKICENVKNMPTNHSLTFLYKFTFPKIFYIRKIKRDISRTGCTVLPSWKTFISRACQLLQVFPSLSITRHIFNFDLCLFKASDRSMWRETFSNIRKISNFIQLKRKTYSRNFFSIPMTILKVSVFCSMIKN